MRKVRVRLGINSYEIHIGSGLLAQAGHRLKEMGFAGKVVIVTTPIVKRLYGDALRQRLTAEGFKAIIMSVPEGEEQKSLETACKLYNELNNFHAERTTPILALGGGVIGDLTGFVAATYLRGMPLVQIPTTLLAQVDSSIGGKVAVNYDKLKNTIGAFYQPRLVISDIATLKSLTPKELSDGLAEIIKYAVIKDKGLFACLERNIGRIRELDAEALEEVVFQSAKIKVEVVEKDEKDLGIRNILNYGHTIGHAIESASNFEVEHGGAVAIGMVAAARISNKMGTLDKSELDRLEGVVGRAGLPIEIPNLKVDRLIEAMKHDKKIQKGRIRFILPKTIGEVFITDEVKPALAEEVLANWNE